ncbi:hypothetical protein ID866_4006 [Astraeus odoratus]|nr:hypothetical protein ID866_4006 [Astraeus odoratus]
MSDNTNYSSPPQHRLHSANEPLPGSGTPAQNDYSDDSIDRHSSGAARGESGRYESEEQFSPGRRAAGNVYETSGDDLGSEGRGRSTGVGADQLQGGEGRSAYNSERPLGVAPAPEGGVAVGGQSNLPGSGANFGDRVIGKTEKVMGKATRNPEMHERGELREAGGKAAAEGRARAPHD